MTVQVPRFSSYTPSASTSTNSIRRHHSDGDPSKPSSSRKRSSPTHELDPKEKRKSCRHKRSRRHRDHASSPVPAFDRSLFFTDTRGDSDALIYGPDQSKIPKAHRASRSQPLGSSNEGLVSVPTQGKTELTDAKTATEPAEPSAIDQLKRLSEGRRAGMQDLPVELLCKILVLSRSSSFPMFCQHFRKACHQASVEQKVDFVLGRWVDFYMTFTFKHPCRAKHKSCRRLASRLESLYKDRDPSWFDFFSAISATDCMTDNIRTANLDVVTFAAEIGICSTTVLDRIVRETSASSLPRAFLAGSNHSSSSSLLPQLPKRIFRRIDHTKVGIKPSLEQSPQESSPPGQVRPIKRNHPHDSEEASADTSPMPSPDDLQFMFAMLIQYNADPSSHQGFPLAMAVHRRSYTLAHLLLLFGANPAHKEGLAVQIAIRNGFLDILRLLVSGPCLDADTAHTQSHLIPAGYALPQQLGSPPFQLDQSHLRLAIQSRQWIVVDFIWHDRKVSPDIACLRLIEKLRQ